METVYNVYGSIVGRFDLNKATKIEVKNLTNGPSNELMKTASGKYVGRGWKTVWRWVKIDKSDVERFVDGRYILGSLPF